MRLRTWFVFAFAVVFVASAAFASAPELQRRTEMKVDDTRIPANELDEIIYMEDFEGDVSDWVPTSPDIQPVYWQTDDWMPNGGSMAWRCFSPNFGHPDFGGYSDDWLQLMLSPALDLSGATAAELSFQFRAYIEDGNWDGANVWVVYGDDMQNLTREIATPTAPAYTETDLEAFNLWYGDAGTYPGWAGEGGETFNTDYVEATFDLSGYAGNNIVFIVFAFASDTAYNSGDNTSMFGFQVDDIVVDVDGSTVWADDADGNNIGGDPTFLTGAEAAGQDVLPYQWEIAEAMGSYANPPSESMIAGVLSDADEAFDHYLEGPEFDLPTLEPGESLWLDVWFNSDIEYTDNFPDELAWRPEVWNPVTNSWVAPATTGNYLYVGGNQSTWELFSESGFTYDWDLSYLAGEEDVRLRLYFTAPEADRDMTHHAVDDLFVEKNALMHDLGTQLIVPYPATVGVPNYGKVYLTNYGPNDETGFNAVWSLDGQVYPLFPGGPYSITAGESLTLSINDPTDPDNEGYWVPDASGSIPVEAYHTLASDEIVENDASAMVVDVWPEGIYEAGVDSRETYGSLTVVPDLDDGPVVHIDPALVNPEIFGQYFDDWDLQAINTLVYFHADAGGAPANAAMDFTVYEGGATPGAEIWTGTYDFGIAEGFTGGLAISMDVSDVAQLQDLTGDFYVQAVVTQDGPLGVYTQPFIYRTAPYSPWQQFQYQNWEDATNNDNIIEWGHHITVTMYQDPASADEQVAAGIPDEFALGQAYPNPFNPSTTLSFDVAKPGNVSLVVYNVMGQEVARVADRQFQAGTHTATFNAADLSSGIYFVRMEAPGFNAVRKIMLTK